MSKILLLYDAPSLLIASMENQLKERGHTIVKSSLEMKELSKVHDKYDAALIYADEDLSDNIEELVYIKDRSTEEDMPLFVAGNPEELNIISRNIPSGLIIKSFLRPINVKDVVDSINTFLEDPGRSAKKKILVVDDSGPMLRSVKGWLEDKYQIALANSGAMAIKYLAMDRPDLVLLDYEMPVVDGRQVLQMIRSETDFSDIPVIFLTSKSDKQSVIDVMSLKPEGYLLKTMPAAEIIKNIDEFFEKKRISKLSQ